MYHTFAFVVPIKNDLIIYASHSACNLFYVWSIPHVLISVNELWIMNCRHLLAGSRRMQWEPGGRCMCTHQMEARICVKWRHDRHLGMYDVISKKRLRQPLRIVTWRTILPNFILIRFQTTERWAFSNDTNNNKNSDVGVGSVHDWKKGKRLKQATRKHPN